MEKTILILIIILSSCSSSIHLKDKYFDCNNLSYKMDSDLKELVYKSLQRAVVTEKDIQDYKYIRNKQKIYVLNQYRLAEVVTTIKFDSIAEVYKFIKPNNDFEYLKPKDIPNKINNVNFCLKSKTELQNIANKTREDFLYLSFDFIKIDNETATIKINNSWKISKSSKSGHLSGGGYICFYKKINGEWVFEKITTRSIS